MTHAEEFIARCASGSGPFFLSFGIDEPHRNNIARPELGIGKEAARFSKTRYYDPDALDWRYTAPLAHLPDLPEIRRDVESLREAVQIMDEYMGRIIHDYVFTEQTYHEALEPIRAVRSERYTLVRRMTTPAPIMRHDGPTTPLLERIGWYERNDDVTELYDLYLDPQEACNRAGDKRYAAVVGELWSALDSWMERTADPFMTGQLPAPPKD